MKKRALGCLGAVLLTSSARSTAQEIGFALDRFEPSERGSQFFANDTLDLRGDGRPALGAVFDYAYKPLVVYAPNGDERSALVRHQLVTHLGASFIFVERLRLAVNVPLSLYQDGESTLVNGQQLKGADKPAVGDIRVAADVRLVGKYRDPFTLAGGVRLWAPTGQASQFTGDGAVRVGPQFLAAGDVGALTYAARVGLNYRAEDKVYAGSALGSDFVFAAAAGAKAMDDKLVIGPELFANSVLGGGAFFKTRGTPVELLLGAHLTEGLLRLGIGGGTGLTRGYGAPAVRGLFSIEVVGAAERPDRDRDYVFDDEDACPDTPGIRDPDPQKNGCPPPPPPDTDRDGIIDREDACPSVPGRMTKDPATNGCPDRDSDTIVDMRDACPDVPGPADPDPKKNGCPPDRDGDGVYDSEDACIDVPGVRDADPKKNGCPPDTDGDGILDNVDACPKLAGPPNQDPKKHGCPLVVVTEKEIRITEQVKFKFDSAELLKESDEILGAVQKVLADHPEIKKVRVEGHTDNVGKPAYNKNLSQKRAASVMKWLVNHDIDKKRLMAQGFGQEEPIDTNETDAGRANNRRVAFMILERDEKAAPPATPGTAPAPSPTPAPKP